jgi:hypothetical protein
MSKTMSNWTHAELTKALGKFVFTAKNRTIIQRAFDSNVDISGNSLARFKVYDLHT